VTYATKSRLMLPAPKLPDDATDVSAPVLHLAIETRKLLEQGYPRKIARKMARRMCGYAS